jgi:hypothetical protein
MHAMCRAILYGCLLQWGVERSCMMTMYMCLWLSVPRSLLRWSSAR